ncbi:ABC transporter permease [Rhizobiaceae bacterium BDR2-2]|uniref:ABC transporter permease n=1 Tax=Ectorhizobium quercum TaxID=2965071 RepID=A0AAE3N7D5_9HYPH|nr:ABC transporter permease [Ectorhizobium quercum]MCX8999932.1 ABC transporter permease [Ectorhizobium quercum]
MSAQEASARIRRFAALVRKETIQVLRDPSSILIAFVLPMVLLFIFGYGVSLDASRTRIGLVIESSTPLTQDLAAAFTASKSFDVAHGRDRRAFEDDLTLGRIGGIVVLPATFTGDFAAGRGPAVQVIVDGSDPNTANFVQNYTQGTVTNWLAMRNSELSISSASVTVQQRFWFNPELSSRFFLVPGSIAIVMTLVGTLLTSLVVAREWERGTMEAIMATPITAMELLAGKILPYFILGLLAMTLCVVIAVFLFGVPFRGSVVALYTLCSAFLIPALGQGLLISAVTKNQFLASMVALLSAFLPAFLLSGFIFEIASMPFPIQQVSRIVPARYLIPSLQSVFLAGDIWPLFARNIAMMLAIGGVFFLIAARSTRKRIG